jgi:hypothetical protein
MFSNWEGQNILQGEPSASFSLPAPLALDPTYMTSTSIAPPADVFIPPGPMDENEGESDDEDGEEDTGPPSQQAETTLKLISNSSDDLSDDEPEVVQPTAAAPQEEVPEIGDDISWNGRECPDTDDICLANTMYIQRDPGQMKLGGSSRRKRPSLETTRISNLSRLLTGGLNPSLAWRTVIAPPPMNLTRKMGARVIVLTIVLVRRSHQSNGKHLIGTLLECEAGLPYPRLRLKMQSDINSLRHPKHNQHGKRGGERIRQPTPDHLRRGRERGLGLPPSRIHSIWQARARAMWRTHIYPQVSNWKSIGIPPDSSLQSSNTPQCTSILVANGHSQSLHRSLSLLFSILWLKSFRIIPPTSSSAIVSIPKASRIVF